MPTASCSADATPDAWQWLSASCALNATCVLEPAVGLVWQRALARATGAELGWYHSVLLAAGLWLVYALDRSLDARSAPPRTLRHEFFARHRAAWSLAIAAVTVLSFALAVGWLSSQDWLAAAGAALAAGLYVGGVHVARVGRGLKKAMAALVYTGGVGAFLWSGTSDLSLLLSGQLLLAALAACNLAWIGILESGALWLFRSLRLLCALLAAGALASAVSFSRGGLLCSGIAMAALLLAALSFWPRPHRELAHTFADLALLLPFAMCL